MSLEAKLTNFLIWKVKIQIYYTQFSSFFAGIVKSIAFWTLSIQIKKRLKGLSLFFASNCNLSTATLSNSSNSVHKALDLTTPAKNRRKMSTIIDLNFQVKTLISLASRQVWNWSSKFTTHSLVFCEMYMSKRL